MTKFKQNDGSLPESDAEAGDERLKTVDLTDVVERYLADLEEGNVPNRETYLFEYAELGTELRSCLDSLELIHQVAPQIIESDQSTTNSSDSPLQPLAQLGDFRIRRELGRGGMGIVYEAEQMSLGRRVAVKVLPFAGMLHGNQLQRFKSEAQAAASLHHPNIVNAFFVGQDRGVHYYAMRLIEGQCVADIVNDLRTSQTGDDAGQVRPALESAMEEEKPNAETEPIAALSTAYVSDRADFYRNVARLAIDAAVALGHAHSMGIVHRDIKPSNLLVDQNGVLWITDFGLAATQTETNLTLTGDLLGTLRYMSPEQAAGEINADPRTDIYSLGATVYEWITLHPVLPGNSRAELLSQHAERVPVRPRAMDARIPKDLENILLKSLARFPSDRYSSADEMADDLRRFLDNKPVIARRPSNFERTVRWASRNRSFVGVLSAALLLLLLLAVGGPLVAVRQRLLVTSETAARKAAVDARQIAIDEQNRATESSRRAKENLQRLQAFLNQALVHTLGAGEGRPEVVQLQRELLRETIRFYKELPELSDDPKIRFDTAIAYGQMARFNSIIHASTDEDTSWLYATSFQILKDLTEQYDSLDHRRELGQAMYKLAGRAKNHMDTDQALSMFHQAIHVTRETIARYPKQQEPRRLLGSCESSIASTHLAIGEMAEANVHASHAVSIFEGNLDDSNQSIAFWGWGTARAYDVQSQIHAEQNALIDAERESSMSARISEQLIKDIEAFPIDHRTHVQLFTGFYQLNYGSILHCVGKTENAEQQVRHAIASKEKLTNAFPHYSWSKSIWNYERLSDILLTAGRQNEAEDLIRKCQSIVSNDEMSNARQRSVAGWLHFRLGQILWRTPRAKEATAAFVQAERNLELAVAAQPDRNSAQRRYSSQQRLVVFWSTCLDSKFRRSQAALELMQITHQPGSGGSWQLLALAQYRSGDWGAALESIAESAKLRAGGDPVDWLMRSMVLARLNRRQEATEWYRRACNGLEQGVPISYGIGVVRNRLEVRELKSEAEELLDIDAESNGSESDSQINANLELTRESKSCCEYRSLKQRFQ